MATKKSFFKERTVAEIKALEPETAGVQELVARIQGLDSDEGIILQAGLTPAKFWRGTDNSATASRRNLKYGFYSWIKQPYSIANAERETAIPVELRQRSLTAALSRDEEAIFCMGYSFRPIVGRDKRRILIPFWSVMDGCKRDTYDQWVKEKFPQFTPGSTIETYEDVVTSDGVEAVVTVPSSTKGKGRYRIRWRHLCDREEGKRVNSWSTRPEYEKEEIGSDAEPTHRVYNIRYGRGRGWTDENYMIYPQDVHSHQVIVREFMRRHNLIPMERSQYAIPSQMAASFWGKLGNNVLVDDPTLEGKDKLRKMHLDEKSMMIGRLAGVEGVENVLYWDAERDGRIKDYDWD